MEKVMDRARGEGGVPAPELIVAPKSLPNGVRDGKIVRGVDVGKRLERQWRGGRRGEAKEATIAPSESGEEGANGGILHQGGSREDLGERRGREGGRRAGREKERDREMVGRRGSEPRGSSRESVAAPARSERKQ